MHPKPCPFCGEMPRMFIDQNEHWRIHCDNVKCEVKPWGFPHKTDQMAWDDWNKWATEPG